VFSVLKSSSFIDWEGINVMKRESLAGEVDDPELSAEGLF
jgi:hypothetical protein